MKHISYGYARIMDHKRLVLVQYFFNLVFAAVALLPTFFMLKEFTGDSMIAEVPGGLESLIFISDTIQNRPGALSGIFNQMGIALGLWLIFTVFMAGGTLEVLKQGQGYKPATFWSGAGSWLMPFVRQLLWSLPLLALIIGSAVLVGVIGKAVYGEAMLGKPAYWLGIAKIGVVVCGLFLWLRILEYGRNEMVLKNLRCARLGFWRGFKFVLKHFIKVLLLSLAFILPGILIFWGHIQLRIAIEHPLALILFSQLILILRFGLKTGLFAAELDYYKAEQPAQALEPEPDRFPSHEPEQVHTPEPERVPMPIGEFDPFRTQGDEEAATTDAPTVTDEAQEEPPPRR